jgi:hypothetical protein
VLLICMICWGYAGVAALVCISAACGGLFADEVYALGISCLTSCCSGMGPSCILQCSWCQFRHVRRIPALMHLDRCLLWGCCGLQ